MFVPIENMADGSRTWVYLSNEKLSEKHQQLIKEGLAEFCSTWSVHGQPLPSSFMILEDQFVVLVADETQLSASGCSIDSSVNALKTLQQKIGVDFFDRNLVPFEIEGQVVVIRRSDLMRKLESGQWDDTTTTFNIHSARLSEVLSRWRIQAGETWLKTYLRKRRIES